MRLKIALRNLYISQAIILLFLIFAYLVWFPYSFAEFGGFYKTAGMLLFADLVLGPLLVFIVFKEGKKYLKFDINVLLSIQIIAFLFGAYSLYLKHPAYAVFKDNHFILTNVSHLYPEPTIQEKLRYTFINKPVLVTTQLPENIQERFNLMLNVDLFGAPDIEKRHHYFKPLTNQFASIMDKQINMETLLNDKSNQKKITLFLKHHGGALRNYAFFAVTGNNKKALLWAFRKSDQQPISIVDIDSRQLLQNQSIRQASLKHKAL